MRFASLQVPGETRLTALIEALDSSFNGVGDPDTVSVRVEGEPGEIPEYMVSDTRWQLLMHSFRAPGRISEPAMRRQAATLLDFLRRKLQEDLASGNPIWVWKACYKVTEPEVCELLAALRRHGPNRLLWVAQSDDAHPPGTVEQLGPHLVRGFVAPPSGGRLENFAAGPWLSVCRAAHLWLRRYPAHTVT